jgi:VRR-NUC domain
VPRAASIPQPSEQAVQRSLCQHLGWRAAPGTFWFHVPNGGWRSPTEAAILKGLGVRPGVPDLICVRDGQCYALELKTERGRLSPAQQQAIAELHAAGAIVDVAYGIDDAIAWLADHGLLRRNARD